MKTTKENTAEKIRAMGAAIRQFSLRANESDMVCACCGRAIRHAVEFQGGIVGRACAAAAAPWPWACWPETRRAAFDVREATNGVVWP